LVWTSSKEEERTWANRVGLVGLFEVEWKTPYHNILVEFLNNWKLDFEHNYKQTSFDKGFKNLPYKKNKGKLGRNIRCQSSTCKHN
jgi:hypothetical protein